MPLNTLLRTLLFILFCLRTLYIGLYYTYLWQLKEYRWDRLRAHLHTPLGNKLLTSPVVFLKWFYLLFTLIFISVQSYSFLIIVYIGIYVLELFYYFLQAKRIKFPVWTLKAVFIYGVFSVLVILSIFIFAVDKLILIQITDRLIFIYMFLCVLFINIPAFLIKNILYLLAWHKISQFKKLTVIGITGSYGKTTAKEFTAHILASKYKVLKTPQFTNTQVGVAMTIIQQLSSDHQIFVVEMGAYKRGEIEAICRMVKPKIGILTAIGPQHLELFGSPEAIIEAKSELYKNLSPGGTIILNLNNKAVENLLPDIRRSRSDLQIWGYTLGSKIKDKNIVQVTDIRLTPASLYFKIKLNNLIFNLSAKLCGIQNIENILAGIIAARLWGFSKEELIKSVASLQSPERTMRLLKNRKTNIIDDTYNANPPGVLSALDYLSLYKGRKLVFLTPLIELGDEAEKIHRHIGQRADGTADMVILTNSNYYKEICQGARKLSQANKILLLSEINIKSLVSDFTKKDVILFEGKESYKLLQTATGYVC